MTAVQPIQEIPIFFKPEMVRAILAGTKTQTRRLIKPSRTPPRVPPVEVKPWIVKEGQEVDDNNRPCWMGFHPDYPTGEKWFSCPYGKVGDILWVRESMIVKEYNPVNSTVIVEYCADGARSNLLPYPSRLKGKPVVGQYLAYGGYREASRITRKITNVRVERVCDISENDAIAEGIESQYSEVLRCNTYRDYGFKPTKFVKYDWLKSPIQSFRTLWNCINNAPDERWEANPWVWIIEYAE